MNTQLDSNNYYSILRDIIAEVKSTRLVIANRINTSMMQMYWNIGKRLFQEGMDKGYGNRVVERLSSDLKNEFPNTSGFSPRSLWDMKRLYEFYYQQNEKLPQSVAVLPWGHHRLILSKIKRKEEALFYINSSLEMGLTRDLLLNFLKADTYKNAKLLPKQHNFDKVLPEQLQEQADEILKSSYNLDFLGFDRPVKERDIEKRIVGKIKRFLLELGQGFTFVGNQYRLTLGQKEYYIDLLFFNRKLKALVAIDLKIGSFEPEYIGKMNFYLGLLDDQIKMPDENTSVGIILCANKDQVEVEVSLRDINKPIGIANYQLQLPEKELKEVIIQEMNLIPMDER